MKNTLLFLLTLSLLFCLSSCEKDEVIDADLHYDGANVTAPFFEAGTYQAAARFVANRTRLFEDRSLEVVEFYLLNRPASCEIRIFDAGTSNTPGPLLFSVDVTNEVQANSWNRYTLSNPIPVAGGDLWIAIRVVHNNRTNTIGCDGGPADANGDWLFSADDNQWLSYRERTDNTVNINWNIRGFVSEE